MTKNRVPLWMAIAVPLIFIGGAVFCVVFYVPVLTRDNIPAPSHTLPPSVEGPVQPPFTDVEERFIGHDEADFLERYGKPTQRINGHYGNPPMSVQRTYPEAFTYVYTKASGSMYLSFCQQRGRWVCFSASWLPEGAAF